ncbi:MAG: hypothetical protein U1F07_16150 [Rubrivivax sp.]
MADVREFSLTPGTRFRTRCGGLFLFLPDLVRLDLDALAARAKLPGSRMVPASHALRCALSLKLWSVERKSHVMALVADPGLALFSGLNVIPKKSFMCEYSSRVERSRSLALLAAWHAGVGGDGLFDAGSFNLDFHSVPYYGEDAQVQSHFVSARSRSRPACWRSSPRTPAGRPFATPTPICARARRRERSSASSSSGAASTARCRASWCSIRG